MSNNNRSGSFAGKGYYIALILCAIAIGITGYVYYQNTKTQEVSIQETIPEELPALSEEDTGIPALATKPAEQVPTVPTTQAPQPTTVPTQPPKRSLKTMSPVEAGKTVMDYSMEALSYNQTTRDWRVHNGVDIAAAEGTPVMAAAEGVVEAAYEDDLMGCTVVIAHDGGYKTTYSSLDKKLSVKAGEAVAMGQVIGCVGSTALVETTLGSHVHFSVLHQNSPMDPEEFLALGK